MLVGDAGAEGTVANALTQVRAFGLRVAAARAIVGEVAEVVEGWKAHFAQAGLREGDIGLLAQYLDGECMREQRLG